MYCVLPADSGRQGSFDFATASLSRSSYSAQDDSSALLQPRLGELHGAAGIRAVPTLTTPWVLKYTLEA